MGKAIITVVGGTKGGTGKTTTAFNLAVLLNQEGYKVLLIDADEEMTTMKVAWNRVMGNIESNWKTIRILGKEIRHNLDQLSSEYDHIIVDAGGGNTNTQRSALCVAHKYVIPLKPRTLDLYSLDNVKKIVDDILPINPDIEIFAFINQADTGGKENENALEYLNQFDFLKPLQITLAQRRSFAYAIENGLGVSEQKKKDKKAVQEMTDLYKYIYR